MLKGESENDKGLYYISRYQQLSNKQINLIIEKCLNYKINDTYIKHIIYHQKNFSNENIDLLINIDSPGDILNILVSNIKR